MLSISLINAKSFHGLELPTSNVNIMYYKLVLKIRKIEWLLSRDIVSGNIRNSAYLRR